MNLCILSEEYPREDTLKYILTRFLKDKKWAGFIDTLRVVPLLSENNFTFTYKIISVTCNNIENIFIKIVKGESSFVDFLIFFQDNEPKITDIPLYAIEETKTDYTESRNTSINQRAAKFVFIENYYPGIKKIMYHRKKGIIKNKIPDTYIFGVRMLKNLSVEFADDFSESLKPFESIDELITFKSKMRPAKEGNTPITIKEINYNQNNKDEYIEISGRLEKSDRLDHDPNIGVITLISSVIRKLGFKKDIVVVKHGLEEKHIKSENKFIRLANKLNIKLLGLSIPKSDFYSDYWKYEKEGEKLATIFIHVITESFTHGYSIFENHAGCEKGYFITAKNENIALKKYRDRDAYKNGDKEAIIKIPDLILIDVNKLEIINIEGKTVKNIKEGIKALDKYDNIEEIYIKEHYKNYKIIRTLVIYGGSKDNIKEIKIGFLLTKNGNIILGIKAPHLFKLAVSNLLDFWKK